MKNLAFEEIRGRRVDGNPEIRKSLIQTIGPIAHRKFQKSSSIKTAFENGGNCIDFWGEGVNPARVTQETRFKKKPLA